MAQRVAVAAANWKMNKLRGEAEAYMAELTQVMDRIDDAVEVIVFAPFTCLDRVAAGAGDARCGVGGQDVFWKDSGAYTGEVSVPMLRDVGCTHVLIGHSERRRRFGVAEPGLEGDLGTVFGDNDMTVNRKLHAVIDGGLLACLCVGETLAERQAGQTDAIIAQQLNKALDSIPTDTIERLLIAYEPVWAIGTGEVCDADEADRVCGVVRSTVGELYDAAAAKAVRVLYGGSMKADNVAGLVERDHIDGGLVGGASLQVDSFKPIIQACARA